MFSFQVLEIYKLWPTKKTALQNYKRQASVVSQKPSVELHIKFWARMKISGEKEIKRAEPSSHSQTKKSQIAFIQA